jgi:hypothetical protein
MKKHLLALMLAIATTLSFTTAVSANPVSENPASAIETMPVQIANPFEDIPVVVGGVLVGTIDITRFVVRQGQLYARAVFTSLTGATEILLIPVTSISGTCEILDLDLGPIHIDLLGLVIDLDEIHLDITAQSGAGKLLGNLLCAIANLLNSGGPFSLASVAQLLNQILGAL